MSTGSMDYQTHRVRLVSLRRKIANSSTSWVRAGLEVGVDGVVDPGAFSEMEIRKGRGPRRSVPSSTHWRVSAILRWGVEERRGSLYVRRVRTWCQLFRILGTYHDSTCGA